MRPAPVFNQVNPARLQQREEHLESRLRFFVIMRSIVNHQIELVRKLLPNDFLERFPIGLRCGEVDKSVFLAGNVVTKGFDRLPAQIYRRDSTGLKELVQKHVTPSLKNSKFKDGSW